MVATARLLHLIFFSLVSYILYSIFYIPVFAQQEFTVSYNTVYSLKTDGAAAVSQEITLSNNFSTIYATSYTLILEGKTPEDIQAFQNKESLPVEVKEEEKKIQITVTFPSAVVGKGKSRTFSIRYRMPRTAVQNGQVWDVTIPKLASPQTVNDYKLTLEVPQSFGNAAYISPEPRAKTTEGDFRRFSFDKDDLVKTGVVAAFGESQIFSFKLAYHLQNPHQGTGETEIALPPDTAFQRVYYEELDPKPLKIKTDKDGNWLAVYRLGAGEKMDIGLKGKAQIFASPQDFYPKVTPEEDGYYLSETDYWQVQDPEIRRIAKTLRTPRAIYDFVTTKLSYDYSRVREDVERLGARKILENPERAICMEFTDLFIALARAAGIPAREINGFAYTENPEIQPLSLIADVLHAWPEYWDGERKIWKPVDPTWGNTTGGVDFFDKFDMSHITFAIHGKDVNSPPPAGSYKASDNPEKDVQVEFGQLPPNRDSLPVITADFTTPLFPFASGTLLVKIENPGPTALYNLPVSVETSDVKLGTERNQTIDFLAPLDTKVISLSVKPELFSPKNAEILISAGEASFMYNIELDKVKIVLLSAIFAVLLAVVASLLILIRARVIKLFAGKLWQHILRFRNKQTGFR